MTQTATAPTPAPTVHDYRRSRSRVLVLLALIVALGLTLTALETGIGDQLVPDYVSTDDFDIDAYERTFDAGSPICAPDGSVTIAHVDCKPFDDHGGIAYAVLMTAIAAAGTALVIGRGARIGWLLIVIPLTDLIGAVATAYATRGAVLDEPNTPGATVAAFVGSTAWIVLLVVLVPRFLLTVPTGHLRSNRWRWATRFTHAVAVLLAAIALLHPLLVASIPNPMALPWSVATADSWFDIVILGMLASWALGLVAVLTRVGGAARRKIPTRASRSTKSP